jgi:predicted Zn-dependent peptidase
MKKFISLIGCSLIAFSSFAQPKIDRTKPPKPGPAPTITFKDPFIDSLPNGMIIIVVENHKLPKISATLSIDRGPIVEGKLAGVNGLMGQMLGEGTTKTSKEKFDLEIDQIGADVSLNAGGGYASALTRYFDKAFMMFAEGLRNPAFPMDAFEKIRSQKITGLKSSEKNASAISGRVLAALSYGKESAQGEFETEESIKALTLNDIKEAYTNNITPSRSYLTFVGDITPADAKKIAVKAFGDWKGKKITLAKLPDAPLVSGTEIDFIDLPTAVQGEINVSNLISNPLSNPDYHSLVIANQILGGGAESKLFMNLREKHGFTYGSYSKVGSGRFQSLFTSSAQVRSEKADSAVAEIMNEINNMRSGKISDEELKNAKAKYNGLFALGMEDPERTASYASNILINKLPKDYYRTFLKKINAVTVSDVQRASQNYFNKDKSRIVIVGNANKILPNLERLGYPVRKYDKYANPVVEKAKEVTIAESGKNSESVSASSIIESYLKAIGGKEELKKINTVRAAFTMDLMNQSFEGVDIKSAPNKHYTEVKMGEMKVMQSSFDGTKGFRAQMGQKADLEAKEIKEAQDDRAIIPQLYYIANDHQTSYLGLGKVGEEEVYRLKVTKPSGKVSVENYSIKSGLLVRDESTTDAGGQEMTIFVDYSDYRKVGAVLLPFKITQIVGEQEFSMNMTTVKINEGVTDADFQQQ